MGGGNTTTQRTSGTTSGTNTFNNTTKSSPYKPAAGLINSILSQAQGVQPTDMSGYIPGLLQSAGNLSQGQLPPGLLDAISYQAMNSAKSNAAAAGRDVTSPGYAASLGGAITRAAAPYSLEAMGLAPSLFATAAGLPYAGLAGLENLTLPIASQFGTSKSSGTGTSQGQQQGLTTTTLPQSPLQVGVGGALGLLGLLSQGTSGGLGGALGSSLAGFL